MLFSSYLETLLYRTPIRLASSPSVYLAREEHGVGDLILQKEAPVYDQEVLGYDGRMARPVDQFERIVPERNHLSRALRCGRQTFEMWTIG